MTKQETPKKRTKKQIREDEKQQAIATLREILTPGHTVYTMVRHVSRSGMSRNIDAYAFVADEDGNNDGEPIRFYLTKLASRALGWPMARNDDGMRVSGCGMDMGFHLVYCLSSVLYPSDAAGDTGNESERGGRRDGGYALKQRWL